MSDSFGQDVLLSTTPTDLAVIYAGAANAASWVQNRSVGSIAVCYSQTGAAPAGGYMMVPPLGYWGGNAPHIWAKALNGTATISIGLGAPDEAGAVTLGPGTNTIGNVVLNAGTSTIGGVELPNNPPIALTLVSGVAQKVDARAFAALAIQVNALVAPDTLTISGSQNNDANSFTPGFVTSAYATVTTGSLGNGRYSGAGAAAFTITWTTGAANPAPAVTVILGN